MLYQEIMAHYFSSLYSVQCMDAPQFIDSPIEGHLGYSLFGAIMNKAVIKIYVKFLHGRKFSTPMGKYL